MASMKINTSEIRALSAEFGRLPPKVEREARAVVKRGAVNIKADLRRQMRKSRWFKGFANINFDLDADGLGAEIGPDKPGRGSGANIAYFGTSRGGGSVEDPAEALNREAANFEEHLAAIIDKVL